MLDLTLRLFTGDSSRRSARDSSVVNADSSSSSSGYIFDMLKEFNNISKQTVFVDSQEHEDVCSKTIHFFPTEQQSEGKANSSRNSDGPGLIQTQTQSLVSRRKNEGLDLNLNCKSADEDDDDNCGPANQSTGQKIEQYRPPVKKNRRGPRTTSSEYRGVTFYRRTGRWESHIWDCGTGRQVYLGGFDTAPAAARAYDLAAIRFRGAEAYLNFDLDNYQEDVKYMNSFTKDEFVMHLRSRMNNAATAVRSETGFVSHDFI